MSAKENRIWLSPPHQSGREMKYVQEAFDSNWLAPIGPNNDAFETELSQYVGCGHTAALCTGTAALHMALTVLGVKQNDIVICQSLTFAASAFPIKHLGAIPVFVDSEKTTWNICPNALEDALKHYDDLGKRPKAVIGVHLYGMPCQLDEILYLCNKYEVPFIEDAAEALGSTYKGKKLGRFGEMAILSFNGNKIITTSGGGALLSNSENNILKAKFLASQARDDAPHYEHSQIGYNYKLSNVCAGIGRGQLEIIEERINQRRSNFDYYKNTLKDVPGISFQDESEGSFSNRWLTTVLIDSKILSGLTPETIRLKLDEVNIESRPLWKPMHLQPVFSHAPYFGGKVSEELFMRGLCLPSGSGLIVLELQKICRVLESIFS